MPFVIPMNPNLTSLNRNEAPAKVLQSTLVFFSPYPREILVLYRDTTNTRYPSALAGSTSQHETAKIRKPEKLVVDQCSVR